MQSRNVLLDFTGAYRYGGKPWGYARVAGALRKLTWDDLRTDQFDLSGSDVGSMGRGMVFLLLRAV